MRFLLIADGGPELGAGHWVRAFALAEYATARGDHATLLTRMPGEPRPPAAWDAAPCAVHVVSSYHDALPPADLAIVDTYPHAGLLASLARMPVVAYDDTGLLIATGVRAVVNPNVGGERFAYRGIDRVYAGAKYATIRRRFHRIRRERTGPVRTIMVGLGGTGNAAAWPAIEYALRPVARHAAIVLYGTLLHPLDWYSAQLGTQVRAVDGYASAWSLLQYADLAIVGLGVTALECLCVGIPTLAYATNDHQRRCLPGWRAGGFPTLSRDRLRALLRDDQTRTQLSARGMDLVDGRGAQRVLAAVR